jgi:Uma2 family endonuclease
MDFARRTKLGTVLTNEAGIVTEENPDTVRGADVVYISFKRLPKEQSPSGYLRAKPELVVEVLGQKDTWESLEEKVTEYHTFGVELVWVVDPNTQTVRIYPRNGQSFVAHGIDKIDGGKGLPGFQCQASEFFSF